MAHVSKVLTVLAVLGVLGVLVLKVLGVLTVLVPGAAGQAPNSSTIVVLVTDQSGAVVNDARVTVVNADTGAVREAVSAGDGSVAISGLSLTGTYAITVSRLGFGREERRAIVLRAGETTTIRIRLLVGPERADVTIYGTAKGRLDGQQIDRTPILGRKLTTLPLLNAAFRQGKGTGDLFVNATYFVTGAGSRRATTFMLDGASNDEGWGRQTMVAAVPLGAVEEVSILSKAFSPEYGWSSGAAMNIVTKSGTNVPHGEGLYMARPGRWQATTFSTRGFCAPGVPTCATPDTLTGITPADVPDELHQLSASAGGPIVADRTFFFAAADYTRQNRTTFLSSALPAFVLPPDGSLRYAGRYRQALVNARLDHRRTPAETLMVRLNLDRMYDTNPNDAVAGTNAPSVARRYARRSWTTQVNHTAVLNSNLVNEMRFAYLHGDPVTRWEAQSLSTTYTRGGSVPFTIGESRSADLFGHQTQLADTLSWARGRHNLRAGGSLVHHRSGGSGTEPGQAILGTFTFFGTTTNPFDRLTLADVQQYAQPISYGIRTYALSQWMSAAFAQDSIRAGDLTIDVGFRYDRQTLTDAVSNVAPRVGVGWHPRGNSRAAIRGGYGMYYTQIRANALAAALTGGLDGLVTYTAAPGQSGFPACLTGSCLPVILDPRTLPLSQQPARNITIRAGRREYYARQFANYGLQFDLLPDYPDALVNPRSQVVSIGAERELVPGLVAGADYVHQHWTNLDRAVDLNAPIPFDRNAPGQTRGVAAANATRPIVPVNGGVRSVNVLMNLGVADYDGLQTEISYRGNRKIHASLSYTLSKATNTTEPDGNGIAPNDANIARLGNMERGPSVVDQRHRAVITIGCRLPYSITAGTVTQLASARPFNATTGIDNNGDGANNDRPVIGGTVVSKSAFRGSGTQDVSVFAERRLRVRRGTLLLRLEGFNVFNHANLLGRAQTTYGDAVAASPTFGQLVSVGTAPNALPSLANIDPPRMFQLQARYIW